MRTFSLIWSGIGCFVTVAITVLGGVILAGGTDNRSRAADGGPYFIMHITLNGSIVYSFDGMESSEGISIYPGYSGIYFASGSQPFTAKLTLKPGYNWTGTEFRHWGEFNVTYEDDMHVMRVTTVGSGNSNGFTLGGPNIYFAGNSHCLHPNVIEVDEVVTVTAHIQMDE
jgi:hypothetical protein